MLLRRGAQLNGSFTAHSQVVPAADNFRHQQ